MSLNREHGFVCAAVALCLTATCAISARADNLLTENFESYAVGSDLNGQGGWIGYNGAGATFVLGGADPALIASGSPLLSQFLNGHNDSSGTLSDYARSLPHALDPNQITTLTFDAYAYSNSHNSWLISRRLIRL